MRGVQSMDAVVSRSSKTPLLDQIENPDDLRQLSETELPRLAAELRTETIDAVSVTGGHLGAGLGVVELTVALHYLFDTPRDRLDLGCQSPDISAQNPHRPSRPDSDAAPGQRPFRFYQAQRKRLRSFRRGTLFNVDFRRPRHGRGAQSQRRQQQCCLRDRRWRHERRHGL